MKRILTLATSCLALAGAANAAEVLVTADITTSTTWTADNVYNLQTQIYVTSGATLTIEPGTVIASTNGLNGALIVTKNGTIMAMGTKKKPIVFTSTADRATWSNGQADTGNWREGANEWGNVTILGDAFMNDHNVVGNVSTCNAANRGNMEGLTRGTSDDQYGGGNDDDSSGVFKYVSLRYGGRSIVPNVELNGLSLGAIGRNTDIHHIEVMNNLDDGIEVWGGTVNLKYLTAWNVGDDSLDLDQGYRGEIQFAFLVQGYSIQTTSQGGGMGDNALEIDGAEDCHWQPVTTTRIHNLTVVGQPDSPGVGRTGTDHGTAWRSNARVQYRNAIFMDLGDRLVGFDNTDGSPDNSCGYGANGTITWADTWTTDFNVPAAPCGFTPQIDGKLAEIKDSVFFNNDSTAAYTESGLRGVTPGNGTNNNVQEPATSPIRYIERAAPVDFSTFRVERVVKIDPRANGDALNAAVSVPGTSFLTANDIRGAFPYTVGGVEVAPWVCGWTAQSAYGFIVGCKARADKL
jgi:hypothetical protein